MSFYALSQYLLLTHAIAFLVIGVVFASLGYKAPRNLNKIKLGWIFIGVFSIIATLLLMWFASMIGFFNLLGLFILFGPFTIIVGLIITLTFGINGLSVGYSKPRNNAMIKRGWACLIINMVIVSSIVTLLILFMSGAIPIVLM